MITAKHSKQFLPNADINYNPSTKTLSVGGDLIMASTNSPYGKIVWEGDEDGAETFLYARNPTSEIIFSYQMLEALWQSV